MPVRSHLQAVNWRHRCAVAVLVCLLAAASVAEVGHLHKDPLNARHACTVCAAHAPALAASPAPIAPPKSTLGPVRVAGEARRGEVATPTAFIRPPPSV